MTQRKDSAPGAGLAIGPGPGFSEPYESLPAESLLDMPVQDFRAAPETRMRKRPLSGQDVDSVAMRVLVLALTSLPALLAAHQFKQTIGLDGFSGWEIAYLALFIPLFAWIAFGFASSVIGFLILMSNGGANISPYRARRPGRLVGRTAVLLPVCNEDFLAVLGRLSLMERSLSGVMGADKFDFFILSDSNPANGEIEEQAHREMQASFSRPVYYRRRAVNTGRKPGNIAEWVQRFGGAYDYMIVLDADSVMGGQTMARLAADLESHPHLGLVQTVPMVAGASTLFQRWQQFANRFYGPIASAGMIWWARSEGTFWGHNAIIRVKAFAESCGLPELKGPPPFGGHIMSHDMVEAALLRRRGWAVHMVIADDSFEEFPPSLPDLATRDRRWCQGNIQHVPLLLRVAGLHMVNRFQLLVGASAYITSPMWLALIALVLAGQWNGAWQGHMTPSDSLLWMTVALLFGPKLLAVIWAMVNYDRRQSFGGTAKMLSTVILETALSILMAPVSMLTQSMNLMGILVGRKSPWSGQTRDRDGIPLLQAVWTFRYHVLLGIGMIAAGLHTNMTMIWLMPVAGGLLFAPVLAALTARKDLGRDLDDRGLFKVPEPWWKAASYRARIASQSASGRHSPSGKPSLTLISNDH